MQPFFREPQKLAVQQKRRKAVISLTPLIDVVFILLVFFMLTSSFMEWQVITMDTHSASQSPVSDTESFVVKVENNRLLLEGRVYSIEALINQLQLRQTGNQTVNVQPIGTTPVQQLIQVLDNLNAANILHLKLIDDPQWQNHTLTEDSHEVP